MKLKCVTITGADSSTDIEWMLDVQQRYPFVEWGILVSKSSEGSFRFPSAAWISSLINKQPQLRTSVHVCGRWVREVCRGDWSDLLLKHGDLLDGAQRVQLNFHAFLHSLADAFFVKSAAINERQGWQFIFQMDGLNDLLLERVREHGLNAVPLFDRSGGAGVLPNVWPLQPEGVYSGYAGGLSPDNIAEQLERIAGVASGDIWVDTETRVRFADDSALDCQAVERFLEVCKYSTYLNGFTELEGPE